MSAKSRSAFPSGATDSNSRLFVKNGSQLVFHLPPGETKKKLAPLVRQCGGVLMSRQQKNVICLADERLWKSGSIPGGSDLYWPTYVTDCVEQNTLLNIELYKCSAGTSLMRTIPSGDGDDDDDDMAPAKTVIRVPVEKKGRMKYTKAEDMNMLKYLMQSGEYQRAKGVAVWRTMEKLQITDHTAQSMMTRYRDVIVPNLDCYNIPDYWKSSLTGNLALAAHTPLPDAGGSDQQAVEKSPETSAPSPSTSKMPQGQDLSLPVQEDLDDFIVLDLEEEEDEFDRQLIQMSTSEERKTAVAAQKTPPRSSGSPPHSQAEPSPAKTSPPPKKRLRVPQGQDGEAEIPAHSSEDEGIASPSKKKLHGSYRQRQKIASRGQGSGDGDEVKGRASHRLRKRVPISPSEEECTDPGSAPPVETETRQHATRSRGLPAPRIPDHQGPGFSESGTRSSVLNPESKKAESRKSKSPRPDPSTKPSTRALSSPGGLRVLRSSSQDSSPSKRKFRSSPSQQKTAPSGEHSPPPKRTPEKRSLPSKQKTAPSGEHSPPPKRTPEKRSLPSKQKTAPSGEHSPPPKRTPEKRSLPSKQKTAPSAQKSQQSPSHLAEDGGEESSPAAQSRQSPSAQQPSTSSVHQRSESLADVQPAPSLRSSRGKRLARRALDTEACRSARERNTKEGTRRGPNKVSNEVNPNDKKSSNQAGVQEDSSHPDITDEEQEAPQRGPKKKGKPSPPKTGARREAQHVAGGELTPPGGSSSAEEEDVRAAEEGTEIQGGVRPQGKMQSSRERTTSSHHLMQAFICSDEEDAEHGTASSASRYQEQRRMTALGVVRALSAEFDLTMAEAAKIYFCNSGHLEATRYWIQTGRTLPGHQYWLPEEDKVLLKRQPDHADWQSLEQQRGLPAVLQRIQWLQTSD